MTSAIGVAVVVGNPKPASRTLAAATYVAGELASEIAGELGGGEPGLVIDLATLGGRLLDWADAEVASLVEQVAGADLVVVATPTYKATFSGLLKLFLDRFSRYDGSGLRGVAVPLMLGAGPVHALAPEVSLRPVLTEIGEPGSATVRGVYVLDSAYDDPASYAAWLGDVGPTVRDLIRGSDRNRLTTGVPA